MNTKTDKSLSEQSVSKKTAKDHFADDADFSVMKALLNARKIAGMSQTQLARKSGIAQENISRIENGNANPSLKTLQRLADGMGAKLKVEFVFGDK